MRLRDIPTAARIELLEPLSQRPSRRYLLQKATTNLQTFFNEIQATGRAWAVCDNPLILTVNSGQSEYLLPVGEDFGRPMDVTTYDPSNPNFNERQVEFTELADQKLLWDGPRNLQVGFDSAGHTAQRMSFYKKGFDGSQYVSVWPVPNGNSSYRIIYSVGEWATQMSLDDSPLLSQHHSLLTIKTALDALPAAAWFASEPENRLRRNELQSSLKDQLPILTQQFRTFVRNNTQPRMNMRALYEIE